MSRHSWDSVVLSSFVTFNVRLDVPATHHRGHRLGSEVKMSLCVTKKSEGKKERKKAGDTQGGTFEISLCKGRHRNVGWPGSLQAIQELNTKHRCPQSSFPP